MKLPMIPGGKNSTYDVPEPYSEGEERVKMEPYFLGLYYRSANHLRFYFIFAITESDHHPKQYRNLL